jgi:hypothetical protein
MKSHTHRVQLAILFIFVVVGFLSSNASAAHRFCVEMKTNYRDNIVWHEFPPSHGWVRAAQHFVAVYRNGTFVNSFTADAEGCTPASFTQAGTYLIRTYPAVDRGAGKKYNVYPNSSQQWRTADFSVSLSASTSGVVTNWVSFTADRLFHVSALATQVRTDALVPNTFYYVYAEESGLSNYSGGVVHLGIIGSEQDAYWKSVSGHEMGHQVQDKLGYQIGKNYTSGNHASQALCKCDQVEFSFDRSHCLQSQEEATAAQNEGFAHFFATTLFNEWSNPIIVYSYYKRAFFTTSVDGDDWGDIPFFVDAKLRPTWLDTRCNTPGNSIVNKGTEMDWFGLYFRMFSTDPDFWGFSQKWPDVYKTACGGSCNGTQLITWTNLNAAVVTRYGLGTPRHEFFTGSSADFGVDH